MSYRFIVTQNVITRLKLHIFSNNLHVPCKQRTDFSFTDFIRSYFHRISLQLPSQALPVLVSQFHRIFPYFLFMVLTTWISAKVTLQTYLLARYLQAGNYVIHL